MMLRNKVAVFKSQMIINPSNWLWICPDSVENCQAQVNQCYGRSGHWEIALHHANEHVRQFHNGGHEHVPHDVQTPANGIRYELGDAHYE